MTEQELAKLPIPSGARGHQIGQIIGVLKVPIPANVQTFGSVTFSSPEQTELRWPVMDVDLKDGSFEKTKSSVEARNDVSKVYVFWWSDKEIREYAESN
jgi:hypothetical protein